MNFNEKFPDIDPKIENFFAQLFDLRQVKLDMLSYFFTKDVAKIIIDYEEADKYYYTYTWEY
jgi:hypothetical protein